MAIVLLGILLSFSRIALVATLFCLIAYIFFQNRRRPRAAVDDGRRFGRNRHLLFAFASLRSAEFSAKFLDRLTLAKSYDVGRRRDGTTRYLLVLPMIMQNPLGLGVLQLEKIFPEPIHNIWLSSFVNYGWVGGFSWITLVIGSVIVSIRNYRRTKDEIAIVLLISLIGIVMCSSLHEGEHWRHTVAVLRPCMGPEPVQYRHGQDAGDNQPRSGGQAASRSAGKRDYSRPRRKDTARALARPDRPAHVALGQECGAICEALHVGLGQPGLGVRADPGEQCHTPQHDHEIDGGDVRFEQRPNALVAIEPGRFQRGNRRIGLVEEMAAAKS